MSRTARKAADRIAVASLGCSRDPDAASPLLAKGPQGTVQFFIQATSGGLYVERDECPIHGAQIIQSLSFTDRATFIRWCEEDPVLIDRPLLHEQLQRVGFGRWGLGADD